MGVGLYDYQLDAIRKMKNGCILCGGVGSGKSRTALGYYFWKNGSDIFSEDYVPMDDPPQDLYIITTPKKRDDNEWEGDMLPFLISTNPEQSIYQHKVVVNSWNNIAKFSDVSGAFFIFDEQRVGGTGKWSKEFLKISRKNNWILLSATPGDCWLDYANIFIANGFYRNMTEFKREHVVYKNFTGFPQVDRYLGVSRLDRLRNSILVDMDFHRPTISHDEDVFVHYDMTEYKYIMKNRWDIWEEKPLENAASLCYALRKITNIDESRTISVLEIFEKHPRVIIFYNFSYELELLRNLYYGEDVVIAEWNGKKHQEIPKSEKWVYLVQYNACEGWCCITTDTIIFYSQTYSYKTLEQAKGRINRLNTPYKDLYYYHLRSRSGIDLAITRALREKKAFNERKFTGWGENRARGA